MTTVTGHTPIHPTAVMAVSKGMTHEEIEELQDSHRRAGHPGLSHRDYFAAQALGGLLANSDLPDLMRRPGVACAKLAEMCYAIADAMLAERDRVPAPHPGGEWDEPGEGTCGGKR